MIKIIKQTGICNYPDDPSFPFKLHVVFSPPEFMDVFWAMANGGTEEVILRGETIEEINIFIGEENWKTHPRFKRYLITDSSGKVVDSFYKFSNDNANA